MFTFLLVCHVIVAAALVGVILMQRSEGGGLAGGSPSGLMSARGATDFLTRTTTILAILFVLLSIGLAGLATVNRAPSTIDTSLARDPAAAIPGAPVPTDAAAPAVTSPVPLAVPATTAAPVVKVQTKPAAAKAKPAQQTSEKPKPVETKSAPTMPAPTAPATPASEPKTN